MILTLHGLDYLVRSPSEYELLSIKPEEAHAARVLVTFTGFRWCIRYEAPGRCPVLRPFATRDAAFQLIASRANA